MFEKQIKSGKIVEGMNLFHKVWALTARIPRGKVSTYGQLAHKLGTRGYRAVGLALNRNPYVPQVPCHRVVGSTGKLTGYALGLGKKKRLLIQEGVPFVGDRVDLEKCTAKL